MFDRFLNTPQRMVLEIKKIKGFSQRLAVVLCSTTEFPRKVIMITVAIKF